MSENLHDTTDAQVWAREFMRTVIDNGALIDEGFMLGWFANAIETGRDAGRLAVTPKPITERGPFHLTDLDPTDPLAWTHAVYMALGYASLCWTETPTGIFDSDAAKQCGDVLIAYLQDVL